MSNIAMLLSNPFRPDPRVIKEARTLAGSGYSVSIVCWDRLSEYEQKEVINPGIEILRLQDVPSGYGLGVKQILPLIRFWKTAFVHLKSINPDLVHCHDFDTLLPGLLFGRYHHIPVIYDSHEYYGDLIGSHLPFYTGVILKKAIHIIERLLSRHASAIIAVDTNHAKRYQSINKQVIIIGHYPSVSVASEPTPVFSHAELNLLYLGRLSVDRGIIMYVDILRSLLKAGIPTKLHLAGDFIPKIDQTIFVRHADDLAKYIIWHGWVDYEHVPELLGKVDVGLALLQPQPYYIQAMPVKIFEYMAAGLPILTSNFPLLKEIITQVNCGEVVDPMSLEDAVSVLAHWWHNPTQAVSLGQNSYYAIQNKYNWQSLGEQLLSLYGYLLGS
jgi:glycosyltransferase involved in cell wall biosynthesis